MSLWCLLLQLDLVNREGQGNLVDPSVHDQADLYLPLNPLDRNSLFEIIKLTDRNTAYSWMVRWWLHNKTFVD